MDIHWSDWVAVGLMAGIALFMVGWYVREHAERRREQQSDGADGADVAA